jgi:hypothetical protein
LSDVENLFDLGTKEEEILKFYAQYEKEGNWEIFSLITDTE